MKRPGWVFDARSIIDPKEVMDSGLNFWRIGDEVFSKSRGVIFFSLTLS